MSLWLDSRPLHGRRQGGNGERLPQGRLTFTLGGSLREEETKTELRNSLSSKCVLEQPMERIPNEY